MARKSPTIEEVKKLKIELEKEIAGLIMDLDLIY